MSNLIFISGDFSSGSTLLFTLFRKTGEYYCLYEPLHEKLLEYLLWPLQVDEHHFFVENYFTEFKGFRKIPELFNPEWGTQNLYLPPTARADDLYRYFSYLIGTAFGQSAKVLLKENRITFRLGWIRANFPYAKIIHIYRDKQAQWNSVVRRVQAHLGREDVGQGEVTFEGFRMASWCEDLKSIFPQLDAKHFQTGYERFCKLWELSYAENQRYADISIDYWALTHDFEVTFERIRNCIGGNFDIPSLKQFVIPPEKQKPLERHPSGIRRHIQNVFEKIGRKYSKTVLLTRSLLQGRNNLVKNLLNPRSRQKSR